MSETSTPARPRQLTMAGGFVIGGSVFLVLTVFDTFGALQSVEMREDVSKALASPTGRGLGISIEDALALMRVGLMVAAASAAAAAVLGVYALQRNRAARVALSVLAVPILLTAPLTGGLMGALVAAATVMLWSGPARDWFAGRPVRETPARAGRSSGSAPRPPQQDGRSDTSSGGAGSAQYPTTTPASGTGGGTSAAPVSTVGTSTAPAATSGFGERPAAQPPEPQGPWSGPERPGAPQPWADAPATSVPLTVKVACVLTWVFSGVVALLYAGMLLTLAVAQDQLLDVFKATPELERADIDPDMLVPLLWVGCLAFLGWALGACLLAWFAWRRHNWARWLLAVSAGVTVVAALFAFPFGLLHQLAAALTVAGLFSSAARAWFTPAPWGQGPPTGHSGQPGQPGTTAAGSSEPTPDQDPPDGPGAYPGGPSNPGQGPGEGPRHGPSSGGQPPVW